jgi:hypothetical protein
MRARASRLIERCGGRLLAAGALAILALAGCNGASTSGPSQHASSDKAITAFVFRAAVNAALTADASGAIGGTSIALTVPAGTSVTNLAPSIIITGASVSPASGAARDFTHPVTYVVTAADASTQSYTATVTIADPPPPPPPPGEAIGYAQCPAPASGGTTYTIGLVSGGNPAGPQTIAAFTHWNDLAAGDVVCIYGKAAPYAERLVLTRGGSDDAHRVRVVGVVQGGHEPILSGKGATTAAAFDYGSNIAENYEGGEVSITGLDYGVPVAYLSVEGLTIQGATTADVRGTAANPTYAINTFADPNINGGAQTAWGCGASGVNIIRADHVSLIHDRLRNNDNGLFVNSNNGNTSSNILVAYSHIYGNGVSGGAQSARNPKGCTFDAHGVYTEARNITFLANRFGALRLGEETNLLKDRSSGLVVAYNFFEAGGSRERTLGDTLLVGASPGGFGHILDLVESYDDSVGLNALGAAYDHVSVYGNVFFDDSAGANGNQGTTVPLHFGGDTDAASYRHHLHFYNNTVVARRDSSSTDGTTGWFEMEPGTNAEAWNNIFYGSANTTSQAQSFALLDTYCYSRPSPCGTVSYGAQNWSSPLWGTTGVNGSAAASPFVDLANNDVHLASNDPTIVGNGQVGNPAYPADATTVPSEYVDFLSSAPRPYSNAAIDLGAFGYAP